MSAAVWPPAYAGASPCPGVVGAHEHTYPPAGWPSREQVEYTRELILLALLIIALPWLVSTLASAPQVIFTGKKSLSTRGLGT